MKINIAIDGPSAAGKSSVADILSSRLSYIHLDTGAMYRAVAYCALNRGIALDDEDEIEKMIESMDLDMSDSGKIYLDGEEISDRIRNNDISMAASNVSKLAKVRNALVNLQQNLASSKGYILDGRDIGTVVLKDAEVKIFLVASSRQRAMRRYLQDKQRGVDADFDEILKDIEKRDYQDMHRSNSPLRKADDAIELDTSNMSIDEVVDRIMEIVNLKLK